MIEFLHVFFAYLNVFAHLGALNVSAQLVLILHNLILEESNLLHQVLIKLIFMYLTTFFSKQLHFFFGHGKNQHLLIFV